MHRIDGAGNVGGMWVAEDAATEQPPTEFTAAWLNDLQEELCGFIEGEGIALVKGNRAQVRQAFASMIARATGNDYKASVRLATTANIANLAAGAPSVVDGQAVNAGDRILVPFQNDASQNGLFEVVTVGTGANGVWVRSDDANTDGQLTSGTLVAVEAGAAQADSLWMLTTDGAIVIGTTAQTWARKDSIAATATVPGIVELATAAEAIAGTDAVRAVTPAALAAALSAAIAGSGALIASKTVTYTATASSSVVLPWDSTIPQNTEGTEIMTLSYTPKAAGHVLRISAGCWTSVNSNVYNVVAALFKSGTADALSMGVGRLPIDSTAIYVPLYAEFTTTDTTALTFSVRGGPTSSSTFTFNPASLAAKGISFIKIEEYLP